MGTKLDAIVTQIEALKATMQSQGQEALKEAFVEFFEAWPGAEAITWRQYTPYFNDGETCEFGVHDFYVKRTGVIYEGYDEEPGDSNWSLEETPDAPLGVALGTLEKSCQKIESTMRDVFGDHVQVVATRAGFAVTEYEHE